MAAVNNEYLVQHLNSIIHGDNMEVMKNMPEGSVDFIFADPPYNLGMKKPTILDNSYRGGKTQQLGVVEQWDDIGTTKDYKAFTRKWMAACRRILTDDGSMFIIGTRHCIYTIGYIAQKLKMHVSQDIIWYKLNNRPNMHTRSLLHQHETILWITKSSKSKYTLNYHTAKNLGIRTPRGTVALTQAGSVWQMPICGKGDRIYNEDGKAFHPTQKPWELVKNLVLIASNKGDLVFDPFSGSGTTCAVAKAYERNYIGVEKEEKYIAGSRSRVKNQKVEDNLLSSASYDKNRSNNRAKKGNNTLFKRQVPYGSKNPRKTAR